MAAIDVQGGNKRAPAPQRHRRRVRTSSLGGARCLPSHARRRRHLAQHREAAGIAAVHIAASGIAVGIAVGNAAVGIAAVGIAAVGIAVGTAVDHVKVCSRRACSGATAIGNARHLRNKATPFTEKRHAIYGIRPRHFIYGIRPRHLRNKATPFTE
jgi:hypothetical protein